jgi:hypothetical protein
MPNQERDAALDPSFFAGRMLVEILTWDWPLHVGLSTKLTPRKYRVQGGLNLGRSIDIAGRIVAPREQRDSNIRVMLLPFGPKISFGPGNMDEVGRIYLPNTAAARAGFRATLMLPEDALPTTAVCFSSVWKHIHIWTFDTDEEEARVRHYSFSATLSEQVRAWAEGR